MRNLFAACALFALACNGSGVEDDAGTDAQVSTLDCATYCADLSALCAADTAQFPNAATCMASCGTWPVGRMSDTGGNTLGCRVYHLSEVEELGPQHCDHAGPAGGEGCGSNCDGFCTIALSACTGANEQYADLVECMAECEDFRDFEEYFANVTSGNSLACRLAHLVRASESEAQAAIECPNIVEASPACQ
jgi:hypothetical protein